MLRVDVASRSKLLLPLKIPLLFARRPFLALLAIRVFLIYHVYPALTANNLVAFCLVGFDRCSNFHLYIPQDRKPILYEEMRFPRKDKL